MTNHCDWFSCSRELGDDANCSAVESQTVGIDNPAWKNSDVVRVGIKGIEVEVGIDSFGTLHIVHDCLYDASPGRCYGHTNLSCREVGDRT